MRRNVGYVLDCGNKDYVKAMDEVVIAIMAEKKSCVDNIVFILCIKIILWSR